MKYRHRQIEELINKLEYYIIGLTDNINYYNDNYWIIEKKVNYPDRIRILKKCKIYIKYYPKCIKIIKNIIKSIIIDQYNEGYYNGQSNLKLEIDNIVFKGSK
jgi:hypothetical protein